MTSSRSHDEMVQQQFSSQASRFEPYVTAQGNRDVLDWIMGNLELQSNFDVLDVAAGTGLVARKIAPYVRKAVAADATPAMLAQGRKQADAEAIGNVLFEEADARRLPYADASFDLVTCRLGMHHFEDPKEQLREMVRVCSPEGRVAIIDIVTSEDQESATLHNYLERLRDPSHTVALTSGQLSGLAKDCGLEIVNSDQYDAERALDDWMDLTGTSPEARETIIGEMEKELHGGPATGMHPFRQDGQLMFYHFWAMMLCRKTV